jgi:hypothetical protein
MRHYNDNSMMQTLELMYLNNQIRDMRLGLPPRRGPTWDVGPGCLLKFLALAAIMVLMVYRLGHDSAGQQALDESEPEQSEAAAESAATRPGPPEYEGLNPDSDKMPQPIRLWTDASGQYHVEAALVDCTADVVCLRKVNDRLVRVAVNRLSPDDRAYVRANFPNSQ